jgi:ABC-type lipoprotein export system ATPase subunit
VVLADEPTGNLDSRTGREIMDLLAELNGQGRTIIMVTHEADMAAYAGRRLYMKDGLIEREEGGAPC